MARPGDGAFLAGVRNGNALSMRRPDGHDGAGPASAHDPRSPRPTVIDANHSWACGQWPIAPCDDRVRCRRRSRRRPPRRRVATMTFVHLDVALRQCPDAAVLATWIVGASRRYGGLPSRSGPEHGRRRIPARFTNGREGVMPDGTHDPEGMTNGPQTSACARRGSRGTGAWTLVCVGHPDSVPHACLPRRVAGSDVSRCALPRQDHRGMGGAMPIPDDRGAGTRYALLAFDADGRERMDDPDSPTDRSHGRCSMISRPSGPPTSSSCVTAGGRYHPRRRSNTIGGIAAMDRSPDPGRSRKSQARFQAIPHRCPLAESTVGDEELGSGPAAFDEPADPIALYVERFGDRPGSENVSRPYSARRARDPAADRLPPDAEAAYRTSTACSRDWARPASALPRRRSRTVRSPGLLRGFLEEDSFGFGCRGLGGILAPLRQLSFWKMKSRAQIRREGGMHAFLRALQSSSAHHGADDHLDGSQLRCIVASGMLCGPATADSRASSIASLALVQGALSHWSTAERFPEAVGPFWDISGAAR